MMQFTLREAQQRLPHLLAETRASHEPVYIHGEKSNGVLLAEEDWQAIQETLYLLSIPGMRESIRAGMATPLNECEQDLDW